MTDDWDEILALDKWLGEHWLTDSLGLDLTEMVRTCSKCGEEKPRPMFHTQAAKGKAHPYCKDCRGEYVAAWHKDHKEEVAAYMKQYHKERRENDPKWAAKQNAYSKNRYANDYEYREKLKARWRLIQKERYVMKIHLFKHHSMHKGRPVKVTLCGQKISGEDTDNPNPTTVWKDATCGSCLLVYEHHKLREPLPHE